MTIIGVWFSQITMPAQDAYIRLFEKTEIQTAGTSLNEVNGIGIALQPIFQAVVQVALNIFDGSKGRSSRRKEVL